MSFFAAILVALLLPVTAGAPAGSPSPSPSPQALRTIVTVKSSPYCTALSDHFNGAMLPMLANDRVFAVVDVQLSDLNELFNYPNYIDRFVVLRGKLLKESGVLSASLRPIQQQIDQLRASAALSNDPNEQKQMIDTASQLQDAYKHQFQLSTDLAGMAQAMMDYDIFHGSHPLGGWTPYENSLPADEKDVKSYLKYDKQLKSIDDAESGAVDLAYSIAEKSCAK
jgi:hypothetical protein